MEPTHTKKTKKPYYKQLKRYHQQLKKPRGSSLKIPYEVLLVLAMLSVSLIYLFLKGSASGILR